MGFSKTSLSLLLFFVLFSSSYATSRTITQHQRFQLKTTFSPNQGAEKLIRNLNLFPKDPVNIKHGNLPVDFAPGKIVEKKFSILSDSYGTSVENLDQHSGFYWLPRAPLGSRLFYYFFESRSGSKDAPVVLWLTGGPGCSSELALFYENGPFKINDDLSLVWNDYGWDKESNIIFVDQPIGTGFSFAADVSAIPHDENGVSEDLYVFMQEFFMEHTDLIKNDFYITGESYAGKYVPALASRIHHGNKVNPKININLKGIAIGNGFTNPRVQYPLYTRYATDAKLISEGDRQDIDDNLLPECVTASQACDLQGGESCITASEKCDAILNTILTIAGNVNYYDIRRSCHGELCYDFSKVEKFLNNATVRDLLGVGNEFVSCSKVVYDAMRQDLMKNLDVDIPTLLEDGIKVLIYAGEFDLICNWLGNYNWVSLLKWSGSEQFTLSKEVPFFVDRDEAGSLHSYGPLSFLKVYGAGHMVPMDQPKVALQMLVDWMEGSLGV